MMDGDAETLQLARHALDIFEHLGYRPEDVASTEAAEAVAQILNAESARDRAFAERDRACAAAVAAQAAVAALYWVGQSEPCAEPCALPPAAIGVELAERMIAAEQGADPADEADDDR
jgi:hypothetical protein